MPKRNAKGRFTKRTSSKRRTHRRRRSNPANPLNPPARRRRRSSSSRSRNPSVLGMLKQGAKDALGVTLGKAAARAVPVLVKLPQQGAVGIASQAATGVLMGYAVDRFFGREMGRMFLAGALSAPLETLVVSNNVPFLGKALSPATAATTVGAYKGLRAYVQPSPMAAARMAPQAAARLMAARGVSSYVQPPGSSMRGYYGNDYPYSS